MSWAEVSGAFGDLGTFLPLTVCVETASCLFSPVHNSVLGVPLVHVTPYAASVPSNPVRTP